MSDAVTRRDVEFEDDDASLDAEQDFVLPPKGGLSRLAMAFAIGLLAAGTFTGGVLVQKHHDKGLTSSSTSGLPAGLGTGSGFPAGFPGATTTGGAATTGSGTAAAAGNGGSTSTGLAVIGSVVSVSGTDVTVKDLGGKTHTIHTSTTTTVTRSQTQTLSSLTTGTQVNVTGTTATDGTVTATAITAR
jgi:hypothetical protein